ncbi:MAG: hypothetical protein E7019_03360 [Alphaproteobacteria bacterium]|nr:hypothetical protein [Alphaproteobacteria bacterium]
MAEDKETLKYSAKGLSDSDKKQIKESFSDEDLKEMKEFLETQTLAGRVKALEEEIRGLELSKDDAGYLSSDIDENRKLHNKLKEAEKRLQSLHSSTDPTRLATIDEIKEEYYTSVANRDELRKYYNDYVRNRENITKRYDEQIQKCSDRGEDPGKWIEQKEKAQKEQVEIVAKIREITGLDVVAEEQKVRDRAAYYPIKSGEFEVRREVIQAEEALQFINGLIVERKIDPILKDIEEKLDKEVSYGELQKIKKDLQDKTLEGQIAELEKQIKAIGVNSPDIGYGDSKEDREYASLIKRLTVLRSVETQEKNGTLSPDSIDSQITEIERDRELSSEQKAQKLEELKIYKEVVSVQDQLSRVDDAIREKEANQGQEKIKKEFAEYAQETLGKTAKDEVSDEEFGKLIKKFEQGVDGFTQEEAVHFLEAWSSKELEWDGGLSRKTKLDVDMTPENAEKIAKLINKLPDTGDEKKLSHWRFTPVTHLRRWGNTVAMDVVTNRIKRRNERHAKKLYREEYKLYGDVYSNHDPQKIGSIIKGKWYERNLEKKVKKVESADLTKVNGYLKQKIALGKEKLSYKKATIKSMVERQEELTKKLEALNKKREELQGKSVRTKQENKELKETMRQIQSYTELHNVLDVKLKERSKVAEDKINALKSKHQESVAPLKQRVVSRYNKISKKTSILDQSTTKGKYLYKLLQSVPAEQRKALEDLVNGLTQEQLRDDATYKEYIKEKMQVAGRNGSIISDAKAEFIAEILKEETGHITYNSVQKQPEENTDTLQENTDTAGYDDQPQAQAQAKAEEQDRKERDAALNEETDQAQAEADAEEKKEEIEKEIEGQKEEAQKTGRVIINEGEVEKQINTQVRDFTAAFTDYSAFSDVDYEVSKTDIANTLVFEDKKDGHEFKIEHSEENHYNLSAKSKNGENKVPSVDDMRSMLQALKQEGHDSVDLGTVKNPEFLANMIVAAQEVGITIDNQKEIEERMKASGKESDLEAAKKNAEKGREVKEEEYQKIAERVGYIEPEKPQENNKEVEGSERADQKGDGKADKSKSSEPTSEQVDETKKSLDALVKINDMTPQQYEEYKKSAEFTGLSQKQQNMLDAIHGLQEAKKSGKLNSTDSRYYQLIGKVVGDYKRISDGGAKKRDKTARQKTYAKIVATNLAKAQGGR